MPCFMLQQRRFLQLVQRNARGGITVLDTETGAVADKSNGSPKILKAFFPPPESLHPAFVPFSIYSFLASVCSSIGGVLSTQSLLVAAGQISPSVSSGIGLAATINWVLKDGLGQLGGIIFAAKLGPKLDMDP